MVESETELFKARLKTSEECRNILIASLWELRARFADLAVELEKHSNDHIHDEDDADRLGAAVEGVCADRINAILSRCNDPQPERKEANSPEPRA